MSSDKPSASSILRASFAGILVSGAMGNALPVDGTPVALNVPAGQVLKQQAHAVGVHIYQCRASKEDAPRFEWTFKEPFAALFDRAGKKFGKHYAGPTWEASDGSKVSGELIAHAASPDPHSVAWLLVSVKSASGNGVFSAVKFVQRLNTVGENAPAAGCSQNGIGQEVRASYTADYLFFGAKS